MKTQNGIAWPKTKEVRIPLYGRRALHLVKTKQAFNQAMANRGILKSEMEGVAGRTCATYDDDGYTIYLVGWFDGDRSVLVHELSHVCFFIFSEVGIDARDSDGEAFCYLLQYLCKQFI